MRGRKKDWVGQEFTSKRRRKIRPKLLNYPTTIKNSYHYVFYPHIGHMELIWDIPPNMRLMDLNQYLIYTCTLDQTHGEEPRMVHAESGMGYW